MKEYPLTASSSERIENGERMERMYLALLVKILIISTG